MLDSAPKASASKEAIAAEEAVVKMSPNELHQKVTEQLKEAENQEQAEEQVDGQPDLGKSAASLRCRSW